MSGTTLEVPWWAVLAVMMLMITTVTMGIEMRRLRLRMQRLEAYALRVSRLRHPAQRG